MTATTKRAIATVLAIALAIEVGVVVVGLLTRSPRGPASSSYSVGHTGASAFADLAERAGHPVRRQRVPADLERLAPSATAVILEGDRPADEEIDALERFVDRGGRLVLASTGDHDEWASRFTGGSLRRGTLLLVCRPLASVAETSGVTEVESAEQPGFFDTEGAVPILGCNESALAAVVAHGEGRVVLVSDPAVFQNFLLSARDNARFALNALGGVNREVVFLEHLHGFQAAGGLAALPWPWLAAVLVLVVAGIAIALARRRPALVTTDVVPGRLHGQALAAALAARPTRELAPLSQELARRALARAGRLPVTADDDALRAAADRVGVAPHDAELVLAGAPDDATLAAATRTLERVTGGHERGEPRA